MGQRAPSAHLLRTPSWREWLIHQRVVLPYRKTLSGWRNGLAGASYGLMRGTAKSCSKASRTIGSRWPCVGRSGDLKTTPTSNTLWFCKQDLLKSTISVHLFSFAGWKNQQLFTELYYYQNSSVVKLQRERILINKYFISCLFLGQYAQHPFIPTTPCLNCRNLSKRCCKIDMKDHHSAMPSILSFFFKWVKM